MIIGYQLTNTQLSRGQEYSTRIVITSHTMNDSGAGAITHYALVMDHQMLEAAGEVLPSRQWFMRPILEWEMS